MELNTGKGQAQEQKQARSVAVLVAALGGEGGGVLADWLVDAATRHGFPVQSTSVPGVAQRTGATTYYIEIYPVSRAELAGREPVMSLTPSPGHVDIVAASELVEAGRALQQGFVSSDRTMLIASTHREYAVVEKSAMADGRYDASHVESAAQRLARGMVLGDLRALALQHGTVINTVMFGAMVGAGALPMSRQACEEAIRHSGKAVEASLRGFEAGHALASAPAAQREASEQSAGKPAAHPRIATYPEGLRAVADDGLALTVDYQDRRYGELYLDRIEPLIALERDAGGGPAGFRVARETARYLALWMSYEDVIRVADLKTRRTRLVRVRQEVGAREGEPVVLTEYLKPGLDELCSLLPPALARRARRRWAHKGHALNVGLHIKTTSVSGFAALVLLRGLRRWRRMSSRFHEEQQLIGRWLDAVMAAMGCSLALAEELALCGNLVKGYGETNARGRGNLEKILRDHAGQLSQDQPAAVLAERVRAARTAALADPEGRGLAGVLGQPVPEPRAQPIKIVRKPRPVPQVLG